MNIRLVNARCRRQRSALRRCVLRKTGISYDAIAATLGYKGRSGAYKAVITALRDITREPAEELRSLELERLDAMLSGIWEKATTGDTWAIDRAIRLMERRAALLGLDAPQKREERREVVFRQIAEREALSRGLDPAVVLAEAERILAESDA